VNERENRCVFEIDGNSLKIEDRVSKHEFTFDYIFDGSSKQEDLYKIIEPIVDSVSNGYNATIFAYGASGSGKTYTMFGTDEHMGIIPRVCEGIFRSGVNSNATLDKHIKFSFIEIYNDRMRDLLNVVNDDLHIRNCDKGIYIPGLTEKLVYNSDDILSSISLGIKQRRITSTSVNNVSSRSHVVLTITISQLGSDESEIIGKINLVDLAGSENVGKSEVHGVALSEAQNINKSLSSLGNVINALTEVGRDHIPYRDSKLTYLLQDSLGGNSKTIIIAAVNPVISNMSETLGTLKFAKRAKEIKNVPKMNKNASTLNLLKTIENLNKKIELLEYKLSDLQNGNEIDISKKWEMRVISLDKALEVEKMRNKNLSELYEKQRKLCIDILNKEIKSEVNINV
jgi:kinesin family protein 5